MRKRSGALLIATALVACETAPPTLPGYIDETHAKVLGEWLRSQRGIRVASDEDCGCNESLAFMRREGGEPNYHPYYRSGDFNGDGKEDFAVVLLRPQGERQLAVFNDPYGASANPAFLGEAYGALFLNSSNPGPARLLVGEFRSEGAVLEPSGHGYALQFAEEN